MRRYRRLFIFLVFMSLGDSQLTGQSRPFFVDGFHGGIYGHYPLWVTDFILDTLEQYPQWQIGLEIEPETWDTVKLRDPLGYARLINKVKDERIDFTNPTYAQPYLYNILGESIIRQFRYGLEKYAEHFPDLAFTTYAVEEPCFTSSLPQILRQFGFHYAVLKCPNTCWGGYARAFGGPVLQWLGPEGTSILTVPRYASEDLEPGSTWQTIAWSNSSQYIKNSRLQGIDRPVGMCYQDAGWDNGPWLGTGDGVKNNSEYTTWTNYFKSIDSTEINQKWALSQEDFLVNLMWGAPVLQKIAQQVRSAENRLLLAEKIVGMMRLENGYSIPSDRWRNAWRPLMLAQHHDSWIVPYNELKEGRTWADAIHNWTASSESMAGSIIKKAIASTSKPIPKKSEHQRFVRVYNTQAERRKEAVMIHLPDSSEVNGVRDSKNQPIAAKVIETEKGKELHFFAEVSGFGYATYRLVHEDRPEAVKRAVRFDEQGNCIIETEAFRLVLDKSKGGTFSSLVAKYAGHKEYVDPQNVYRFGEISGNFYEKGNFYSSKDQPVEFYIVRDDALQTTVEIRGFIDVHPFVQTLNLRSGQQLIDFDLKIDWQGTVGIGEYDQRHDWTDDRRAYTDDRYKLQVLFPTNLTAQTLYKNAPFDVVESRQDSTYFGKWSDIKHNVILNWVDVVEEGNTNGMAVFTDHTTSYVHGTDYPLALTAQYSGLGLWGEDYPITGPLKIRYALAPHQNRWDQAGIATQSNAWNEPLVAEIVEGVDMKDRQFIRFQRRGLEISAVELGEEKVYLRLFNASGSSSPQRVTFDFPVREITQVLLNGDSVRAIPVEQKETTSSFQIAMPRFGLTTLKVEL